MKNTIQSRLIVYSVALILITTFSVLIGAVVLQLYQTRSENRQRLEKALDIFHNDFESQLNTIDTIWNQFTTDKNRTTHFIYPLTFEPYISYIPEQIHQLANQYQALEGALYLPVKGKVNDQLLVYYNQQLPGTVLMTGDNYDDEKIMFIWDEEGFLRQTPTTAIPRLPLEYKKNNTVHLLDNWNGQISQVSHLSYLNTTFEEQSMNIKSGSPIATFVLRTPLDNKLKQIEKRMDVYFTLFDGEGEGGTGTVSLTQLDVAEGVSSGDVFTAESDEGKAYDVLVKPIKNKGKRIGYVAASISKDVFYGRIQATVFVLLLIALGVVIFSILLSWVLVKKMSRPLSDITDAFDEYTGQNQLRAEPITGALIEIQKLSTFLQVNEFKKLTKSFQRMMGFIEEQTQTIELQNQSLEAQIKTIEQKNIELQKTDKLKDEFLASTSHELRTPLHGIIGLAEVMLDSLKSQRSKEEILQLTMIVANGRRLNNLLSDLLDFYKMKEREINVDLTQISLLSLSEAVITFSKPLLGQKNLVLENRISKNIPTISADESKLEQILYNLITNAIKFTQTGSIIVDAKLTDELVEISITDTGIGIPAEKLEQVFEVFTQVDGSMSKEQQGTGLGLSITKKLVELHGSKMMVESEVGKGSCFYFSLPVARASSPLIDYSYPASENIKMLGDRMQDIYPTVSESITNNQTPANRHQHTILVVDDEPANLVILKQCLNSQNYHVLLAKNGIEALSVMEKQIPDLILLDLMMPKMDGYEFCQIIREKWDLISLPILILSAKNRLKDLEKGFQIGANDYLTKPFHPREINARVKTLLLAREAIKHLQENERLLGEIARRKQLELDLKKSHNRLVNILNVEEDAIVCVNKEGEIIFYNQGAEKLFQYQQIDVIGQNSDVLFPNGYVQVDSLNRKTDPPKHYSYLPIQTKSTHVSKAATYVSQIQVDDEELVTIILPHQDQLNSRQQISASTQPINKSVDLVYLQQHLSHHEHKMQTLEKAMNEVARALSSLAIQQRIDEGILSPTDILKNSAEEGAIKNKAIVVSIMTKSLEFWSKNTGKTKTDLAEESKIWNVQLDGGSYKTRTLNKYLKMKTVPKKPRWGSVLSTATYVLDNVNLLPAQKEELEGLLTELKHLLVSA